MFLDKLFSQHTENSDDDGWGGFLGLSSATASGQPVTNDKAMRDTAVYACVRLLAETIGSLPVRVYRAEANGKRTYLPEHPVALLFQGTPNDIHTSFEYRELLQGHVGLRGNGYSFKEVAGRGNVTKLTPIHPDRVEANYTTRGTVVYDIKNVTKDGLPSFGSQKYTTEEIFHVRGFGMDGLVGLNPISYHRETIGQSLAAQDYGSRFFANDATPRGILTHPTKFKDEESLNRFRSSWNLTQNGKNRHKTAVLEDGITYTQTAMTNEDAQFLDSRKYSVTDIARIFRIPPHMIGDLERATFSNISDQAIEFVVHTIRPWCIRWEQAVKRDMIIEPDVFLEFVVDGLLRGDIDARYKAYASGITNGHMTRNEARVLENRNPLPGLDVPLSPKNMGEGDENRREGDEKKPQQQSDGRQAKFQATAIDRIVRKEDAIIAKGIDRDNMLKAMGNHVHFVATVLVIPEALATEVVDGLLSLYDAKTLLSDYATVRTAQIETMLRNSDV